MPWKLLTTPLLTPRTGPLVVSMTRVGESAIASVTPTPKTTRIDVKRPMPGRRCQRVVLSPPAEICRYTRKRSSTEWLGGSMSGPARLWASKPQPSNLVPVLHRPLEPALRKRPNSGHPRTSDLCQRRTPGTIIGAHHPSFPLSPLSFGTRWLVWFRQGHVARLGSQPKLRRATVPV